MFIAERFVYVELHKTGCTYLRELLSRAVAGELRGKHNPPDETLLESGRDFVGSIRNPWEWYVSLWAFGCQGRGGIYQRATTHPVRALGQAVRRWHGPGVLEALRLERSKDWRGWRASYADADDPRRFRMWLTQVLGAEQRRVVHPGYARSALGAHAGLLTFRYARLFCRGSEALLRDPSLGSPERFERFVRAHFYLSDVLRTESLCEGVARLGERYAIDPARLEAASAEARAMSNRSSWRPPVGRYYDARTIALVGERERLIVETFGYRPPELLES